MEREEYLKMQLRAIAYYLKADIPDEQKLEHIEDKIYFFRKEFPKGAAE